MNDVAWAEDRLRYEAQLLAGLRQERDTEYLRLVATGTSTWQAQRMVDAEFGPKIVAQEAEYEIAVARVRRA
jgi:hypothetical protein